MQADIDRILIPRNRIADRVSQLAAEITRVYTEEGDTELVLAAILSGSVIFLADLMRQLPMRMRMGLITVSSYRGATTESLGVQLHQELTLDVNGRHVLVVDDILDTGHTLRFGREQLAQSKPKSLRTCVLLRKPGKAPADVIEKVKDKHRVLTEKQEKLQAGKERIQGML